MFKKITQAIILSAGIGKRLRPLTDNLPKVMVPIGGKPLLEHHLEQFKKCGVKEFFISLYYLSDKIIDYFGDGSKWGVKIFYKYKYELKNLGTARAIKIFESNLKDNFFVIYGDIFSLVDYSKMNEFFNQKTEAIGMELIGDTDHPFDSDLVEVDDKLRFLKIYPKPHKVLPKKYKSMRGIYIFNEKILKYIPSSAYYEIDHNLLPDILSKGEKFYGYESDDYLKDIGTLERYQKVQEYLENKED